MLLLCLHPYGYNLSLRDEVCMVFIIVWKFTSLADHLFYVFDEVYVLYVWDLCSVDDCVQFIYLHRVHRCFLIFDCLKIACMQ